MSILTVTSVNPYVIMIMSASAISIAISASLYDNKIGDKKYEQAVLFISSLAYVSALGWLAFRDDNKLGAGIILISSLMIALCGYYYSKSKCEDDKKMKNNSLLVGLMVGVGLFATGVAFVHKKIDLTTLYSSQ